MKTSLKKKFWINLLSGIITLASLTIPAITLTSCAIFSPNKLSKPEDDNNQDSENDSNQSGSNNGNNQGDSSGSNGSGSNNGNNQGGGSGSNNGNNCSGSEGPSFPDSVLPPPDTSNSITFAQAKKFAIDYLKKNYNMELFNRDAKHGLYQYVLDVKERYENMGAEVVDYALEFNAYEENNKIFFDGEYRIHIIDGPRWIKLQNNMSVQNAKIEPIFVLRNNVVHVELAVSYSVFIPSSRKSYNSLEELKAHNPDWQDRVIVHTINEGSNNLGGSGGSKENRWLIIENKSGGDYILKPNVSDDSVSFLDNWNTIKLLSLPISFTNISDINANLKPE